jgi:hypothetical protein
MMHAMKNFTVRVAKAEILALLRTNKRHHADNFERLDAAFRKRAIAIMERNLAAAREGRQFTLHIELRMPRSYEKAYAEAIGLLEMSVDETIELTGQLYQGWILDEWEWTEDFYGFMREGDLPDSKTYNKF